MCAGTFDSEINTIIYVGQLIALSKKDGGVRPIAVGYVLRRLAVKCATHMWSKIAVQSFNQDKWSWSCSWSRNSHTCYSLIHQSAIIKPCVHQTRLCKCIQHSKAGPTSRHSGKKHIRAVPIHIRHLWVWPDSRLRQSHNLIQRRSATGWSAKLIGVLWIDPTYPQWTQLWSGNWFYRRSVHDIWSPHACKRRWKNHQSWDIHGIQA